MTDKQPEALRLADAIDRYKAGVHSLAVYADFIKAAAELRRLHFDNAALNACLFQLREEMKQASPEGCTPADARVLREANHALAQENHELRSRLAQPDLEPGREKNT